LGNGGGVLIQHSWGNTIGGTTSDARNLISANKGHGVFIQGATSTDNLTQGNYIGTNAQGMDALGNSWAGVSIERASRTTIGGTTAEARNVISGNNLSGLYGYGLGFVSSDDSLVQGNYIGVNAIGSAALPNNGYGLSIGNSARTLIGGTAPGARNILSGNTYYGIGIGGSQATQNVVQGNVVGLDVNGTVALVNGGGGVLLQDSPGNTIGGTATAARNLISANAREGILISGVAASDNHVQGNYIGTDVTGNLDRGNSHGGEFGGVSIIGAPRNTIGGTISGAGNLISGNDSTGIWVEGAEATETQIQGNYIGTNAQGTAALGNVDSGVIIYQASRTTIGGTTAAARNVISGNVSNTPEGGAGIQLASSDYNLVQGNFIGVDATGTVAIGNEHVGVGISGSSNIIGGLVPEARNVISGNKGDGVILFFEATENRVQGNYIGLDRAGNVAVPNESNGIQIVEVPNNFIGGKEPGAGNIIAGNSGSGILILSTDPDANGGGNSIQGNFIGTNKDGAPLGNQQHGVLIDRVEGNSTNYFIRTLTCPSIIIRPPRAGVSGSHRPRRS
jgi:titin